MNVPIYRAEKIDSDEYVIGNLIEDEGVFYIIKNPVVTHFNGLQQLTGECEYLDRVDPTTLAINLPDMLDSQGNKIFASLSASGKGGDIMKDDEYYGIAKYVDCKFVVEYENCFDVIDEGNFEVIGIQQ